MAALNPASVGMLLPPGVDVFLVEEQANPSTDYFVLPACTGDGRRVHRYGFAELPPAEALRGAFVVFVRYLPAAWRERVAAMRASLAGVALFMDDDLLDPGASRGMPWRYRYKLYRLAARHREWLRQQQVRVWVSTPWLEQKYAGWDPLRIPPQALASRPPVRRVFYHGSASHDAEVRWLRAVMEQVLCTDQRIVFEIIGGRDVQRLYRGLPRVTVVHPMKWLAYQAFMDMPGRQIGLAPLVDLPFNRARSCTKFFDITRCGAVGLYTEATYCASVVRHGIDGLVLPLHPDAWAESILALLADEPRRLELLGNARAALLDMAG